MKYLFYLMFFLVVSASSYGAVLQEHYKTHIVQKGETLTSISKKYGISPKELLQLNPDAKNGIRENAVIILPKVTHPIASSSSQTPRSFKQHKVKRKETLFSISKKYDVSIDAIKKYNKFLYAAQLRKGDQLQIPVFPTPVIETTQTSTSTVTTPALGTHTVAPKETVYGIARMYGITIAALKALNPTVPENLPIGTLLKVPNVKVVPSAKIDEEAFMLYEVKPKEGFYRLEKNLGVTEEEIIALNPFAKEGLKEGMILKIPKNQTVVALTNTVEKKNLEDYVSYTSTKRIALLLPFQLHKAVSDSTTTSEDVIKNNAAMRVALDFYSGALLAADFAKDQGISVQLEVFDTQGSESVTASIISTNSLENSDAVIGPLLRKTVEKAANVLEETNTPVFSPLTNKNVTMSSNLFQTLPSDAMLKDALLAYLKTYAADKNVVVISDKKHAKQKQLLLNTFPNAKTIAPREEGFVYLVDIEKQLSPSKENWFVLNSDDPIIVGNVVSLLNGMPLEKQIRLFTLDKNDAYEFDDVSNMNLAKLQFTFPSVNKGYDYTKKDAFLVSYKNKYGVLPNKFAVRGFDVTYDVLLRLASEEDVYKASSTDFETEYIENKFRYEKKQFSGYENTAVYVLKYTDQLQFEVQK